MDFTHVVVFLLGITVTLVAVYHKEIALLVEELRWITSGEPDTDGLAVRHMYVGQWEAIHSLRGAERLPQGAERKLVTAAYLIFDGPVTASVVEKELLSRRLKWVSDIETAAALVNASNIVALYDAGGYHGLQFAYRGTFDHIAHPAGGFRGGVMFVAIVEERAVR